MRDSMWRMLRAVWWLCVGCTASATNPSGAPDGSTVAVDLTPVCTAYCAEVMRQCGGPAACMDVCLCGEPRAACHGVYSTFLDCTSRAVLRCPQGLPAVLCQDELRAYTECRDATPAPDGGGACGASSDGGADASADATADATADAIVPRDVMYPPQGTGCTGYCARATAVRCAGWVSDDCETGCQGLELIGRNAGCASEVTAWIRCANGSRFGCDDMGRPTPVDCDAEERARAMCLGF